MLQKRYTNNRKIYTLYQRLNRTRNKHNEDHDTSLTLADFAKNVLGVTVKVSNQTLNQHGSYGEKKNRSRPSICC